MENVAHYVTHHIDEAIEKGWIQLYFQPIIRSLSHTTVPLKPWPAGRIRSGACSRQEISSRSWKKAGRSTNSICIFSSSSARTIIPGRPGPAHGPVSFNLSRLDFITCDIFTEIEKLTQAYQLPPSQLRIEITESVFIKDIETVNQTLNKFRAAGYQIWMDDFGSGYSSLNVLKDYESTPSSWTWPSCRILPTVLRKS